MAVCLWWSMHDLHKSSDSTVFYFLIIISKSAWKDSTPAKSWFYQLCTLWFMEVTSQGDICLHHTGVYFDLIPHTPSCCSKYSLEHQLWFNLPLKIAPTPNNTAFTPDWVTFDNNCDDLFLENTEGKKRKQLLDSISIKLLPVISAGSWGLKPEEALQVPQSSCTFLTSILKVLSCQPRADSPSGPCCLHLTGDDCKLLSEGYWLEVLTFRVKGDWTDAETRFPPQAFFFGGWCTVKSTCQSCLTL